MTLAIAAPSFDRASETFVNAHINTILPQGTVLICEDGHGAERYGLPVLSEIDPYPPFLSATERIAAALRFRWAVNVNRELRGADERRLRTFFLRHGVEACLAEFGPMGCKIALAARNADVNLFVHFHGYDATRLPSERGWQRHFRRLFATADGVLAPSHFIAERLAKLGCPGDKLHVSPCGIAPEDFPETTREPGLVVAVGRLVEKKAPLVALEAFAQVAMTRSDTVLHIVGDGPLGCALRRKIIERNLGDRVVLHGEQPHSVVRSLMARAAVFLQHSVTAPDGDMEGLPVSILEAMASGVPVVSTRHSGIPEAVEEGRTGLLTDEGDVDGTAMALQTLLDDPAKAAAMGAAARARAARDFSHDVVARRLRAVMRLTDPS